MRGIMSGSWSEGAERAGSITSCSGGSGSGCLCVPASPQWVWPLVHCVGPIEVERKALLPPLQVHLPLVLPPQLPQ